MERLRLLLLQVVPQLTITLNHDLQISHLHKIKLKMALSGGQLIQIFFHRRLFRLLNHLEVKNARFERLPALKLKLGVNKI